MEVLSIGSTPEGIDAKNYSEIDAIKWKSGKGVNVGDIITDHAKNVGGAVKEPIRGD